jgi:hypothetical protein
MKKLFTFLICTFLLQSAFGQACGIYRIRYIGSITSDKGTVSSIEFPTTHFLSGLEKISSESAFIGTKPINGEFELDIKSHLGTPYSDVESLLTFYKSKSPTFKMKVWVYGESEKQEIVLDVDWGEIDVTLINDGNFGALFEFRFQEIVL